MMGKVCPCFGISLPLRSSYFAAKKSTSTKIFDILRILLRKLISNEALLSRAPAAKLRSKARELTRLVMLWLVSAPRLILGGIKVTAETALAIGINQEVSDGSVVRTTDPQHIFDGLKIPGCLFSVRSIRIGKLPIG